MINDKQIQAAIRTVQTEIILNDGTTGRGAGSLQLVIRRLSGGGTSALWTALWTVKGKRQKFGMGAYPDISLAMARQQFAGEVSPMIRAGKSPKTAAAAQDDATVEKLFQGYVANMRSKNRASADEVERMLLRAEYNAADALGRHRGAGAIEPEDVVAYVQPFFKRGHRGAADKARSYVASAFAWGIRAANDYTTAERRNWCIKSNPADAVQKDTGAVKQRDRNLDAAELKAVWLAAVPDGANFSEETAACVRLLICCGQRVQETLRMDAEEIHLDAAEWRIPAEKTKGGKRPHTAPLPRQALPVLRSLLALHPTGPLFPARAGSKAERIDHRSIRQCLERWQADAKVKDFQTRDIRRTWKSRTADAGIDRFTRDLIQQHAKNDTGSKSYDRADYRQQMRAAMGKWADWLDANVSDEPQPEALAA